jgi:hypothetical protein
MTKLLANLRDDSRIGLATVLTLTSAVATLAAPVLPSINTNNILNITNAPYNAQSGGVITNTTAIQNAINAAAAGPTTNGLSGGTVEIPAGTFLSGALTLKSHVNIQLDAGATLLFLPESKYPGATGSPAYPLAATNLTDLEISGTGTIDGNGASWWSASQSNPPYMVYFSKCLRVLIQNITLQNSPKMHIVFKNWAGYITIQGITINTTASNAANTDGIDLIGTNCLVQNCTINAGDDNIALGSSSSGAISSDILVTNCTFGVGHGVSIGSNTQGGVSNLTVINCTFNGTDYGIRMKSDNATSGGNGNGGTAQNLSYLNIGMTNIVDAAIVIYSYYNEYGTPTGITPFMASTQTVGSVGTPIWRNIVISNIFGPNGSATVASGGIAGIVWGRIETPVTNILLSHVNITAPKTFDVYNVDGFRLADSQITVPAGNKTLTIYNADVTLTNSAPGSGLVTLDGLSSDNSLALYNAQAATTAGDVFGADPITVSAGTLTVSNSLNLPGASTVNFSVGTNPSVVVATGALTLNSTLNITNGDGFGASTNTLFTYTGSLSGNPVLGATPAGFSYTYSLDTNTTGQVNFVVSSPTPPPPPSPPVFGSVTRAGGNLVMSGTGGTTNGTYYVLSTTNLSLPLIQWQPPVATNQFDGSGNFIFTNAVSPGSPQMFYLLMLQYP